MPVKIILCLSGLDTTEFVQRALPLLPARSEVVLIYVIDTRPAEELNYLRRTHLFGSRIGSSRIQNMEAAEREAGLQIINEARAVIGASVSSSSLEVTGEVILQGRPEREIVFYIDQNGADLLVIGTRYRSDLNPPPISPPPRRRPPETEPLPRLENKKGRGPQSIGPIARFIIDHVLCDLLIIK